MKRFAVGCLALVFAVPLLFNTTPVKAERTSPVSASASEMNPVLAPVAVYVAAVAFVRLSMAVAAAEVEASAAGSHKPLTTIDAPTKNFD